MNLEPRIVLIDDDRVWAESLADYLRVKGFAVQTAHEGGSGLALLETQSVSLVLVDYHMPDMTGLELLQRVRRVNMSVSILMVSGADEPSLAERAVAGGAAGFLPKTTPPDTLLDSVRQALLKSVAFCKRYLPVPRRASRHFLPVPVQRVAG